MTDELCVAPDDTMLSTLRVINDSTRQIALVVDGDRRLLGTVTDGDVRRALLRGLGVDTAIAQVMNTAPTTVRSDTRRDVLLAHMRRTMLHQVPLVDAEGRLVDLVTVDDLLAETTPDNLVVLMAGGRGSRLGSLTESIPKPLLNVGGRPILETIIGSFAAQGYRQFAISVNYRAEMIEEYFGNGARWRAQIDYIREDEYYGTAGALGLLPVRPTRPLFLMNGDVLSNVDFRRLMQFHVESEAAATVCVRQYRQQVPFGVLHVEGARVTAVREKPVSEHLVNAGIYVLDPALIDQVPPNARLDMPELLRNVIVAGGHVAAFPIRDYWLDIGRPSDFDRAQDEFDEVFQKP